MLTLSGGGWGWRGGGDETANIGRSKTVHYSWCTVHAILPVGAYMVRLRHP